MFQPASIEEFQGKVAELKGKLICIHFGADWAQPCVLVDQILGLQEGSHPEVAFVKVDVPKIPDIAGLFRIASVPTVLFLRDDAQLGKVVGAKPDEIVSSIAKYADPSFIPEDPKKVLNERLRTLIDSHRFMVFIKGTPDAPRCGFTQTLLRKLGELNIAYGHFDILSDNEVRQGLKEYSQWPTYPQIYINGELLGGLDIFLETVENGLLDELISA